MHGAPSWSGRGRPARSVLPSPPMIVWATLPSKARPARSAPPPRSRRTPGKRRAAAMAASRP
ncbi:Hypothetical protein A7982_08008 [Minicystis rosea]|nr:Hypothetical protein A7982_08008 [Minicystis rosea]